MNWGSLLEASFRPVLLAQDSLRRARLGFRLRTEGIWMHRLGSVRIPSRVGSQAVGEWRASLPTHPPAPSLGLWDLPAGIALRAPP